MVQAVGGNDQDDIEVRLRLALDAGRMAVWDVDVEHDRLASSTEMNTLLGFPPDAMPTLQEIRAGYLPGERERMGVLAQEALARGEDHLEGEFGYVRRDGAVRQMLLRARAYLDPSGAPRRYLGVLLDVTDLRAAQEELHQTQTLKSAILEASLDCIVSIDAESRVIEWNPAAEQAFGYSRREVIGQRLDQLIIPPRYRAAHLAGMSHYLLTGDGPVLGKRIELEAIRADRSFIPIELAISALKIDGRPHFTAFIRDISERRSIDAALRESEEHYRHTVELHPQVSWTADASGHLDHIAGRWTEWTGHTGLGTGWTQSLHPDDLEATLKAWTAACASGKPYDMEHRLRLRSGEYRWMRSRAFGRFDGSGKILAWYGTTEDIHERRSAEERLRAREAELRRLNETLESEVESRARDHDRLWRLSQEIMLIADESETIQSVNPSAERVLGWSEAELVGQSIARFIHPDDLERTRRGLRSVLEGAVGKSQKLRCLCTDGSFRLLDWSAVLGEGRIHAVARDITGEHQASERLREAEDALRQAQKMEAVGQLTGGIAHDFNNLLQGITGALDIVGKRLKQGRLDDIERFLSGASGSAARAAALTHRLLAFSRRQPLDPRPVEAEALIRSMEDLIDRTIGEQIVARYDFADPLWCTRCDPNQLENAILNLVINARDAMPDGGELTISARNVVLAAREATPAGVNPGPYVCVSVRDTGSGMPADVAERAFEPFFTTKPSGQGTGLGLSMIYGFARQSGGFARIRSAPGAGTTVEVNLPRLTGAAGAESENEPMDEDENLAEEGEIVIVVEDDALVRMMIVDVLTELGYGALEARDGPEGLSVLREAERVDLLITDIGLPGMNGRQLAEAARLERPGLKILFMTGYAEDAAGPEGFLGPGMEMVTKPVTMEILAARIRAMIG